MSSRLSLSMWTIIYGLKKSFPRVRGISGQEIRQSKDRKTLLLDARPLVEYNVSHIPGSIQIDHESTEPWTGVEFKNFDKVVCYCSVGYRSSVLAAKLRPYLKMKEIPVYNLEGGIFQWAMDGGELEGDHSQKVHHFSPIWGKLLPEHMRYTGRANL